MKRLLACLLVFIGLLAFWVIPVKGDEFSDKQKQIDDLQAKVIELQGQAQTLAGQIAFYDGQILLISLKISQTQDQIKSLAGKINTLEVKLQDRSKLLQDQIVHTYKDGGLDPLMLMFSSQNVPQMVSRFKYLQIVQDANRKFLHETQLVQSNYASQKDLIAASQKKLQIQEQSLTSLRAERGDLLAQTQSNEANYQKLLAQARAELESLRAFANFKGGGLLPPQPSPDGWYFNQRDNRWGGDCISNTCLSSPDYVWQVGCLLTDVAMIFKKYGQDVTPLSIAHNSGYFFSNTAYMLIPWPSPPGYHPTLYYSYRKDIIDSELSAGRPVIVHINVNSVDGHFVVLKSGSNGNYTMNDPWEGPDLAFNAYYNTGSITSVTSYTP